MVLLREIGWAGLTQRVYGSGDLVTDGGLVSFVVGSVGKVSMTQWQGMMEKNQTYGLAIV